MAATFGRPTSWLDYCTKVPNVNCANGDEVATRNPLNEEEENSYFVDGFYKGYFQHDDCNANPNTCTGYFVNAPCTWSTYAEAQVSEIST